MSRSPRRDYSSHNRADHDFHHERHDRGDARNYRQRASNPRNDYDGHSPDSRDRYDDRKHDGYDRKRHYDRGNYSTRREYWDRDRDGYRSPGYSRSRSQSTSPPPVRAGQPNCELILDGLAVDLTEEEVGIHHSPPAQPNNIHCEIFAILKRDYNVPALEEVRVIRDKQTRQSRGFGFIKFKSLGEAEDFIHDNFPSIYLSKDSTSGDNETAKVRIAYSRERNVNDGVAEGDWGCPNCQFRNFAGRKVCFKCQAPYTATLPDVGKPSFANNGDSDVSLNGTPSQFLVIRGLEPSVTEDLLHKGVAKLFKPSADAISTQPHGKKGKVSSTTDNTNLGAREDSLRRILLVKDRQTNESWKYGFAEYASIDDAQAALTRFNSFDKFTISSKPVYVSFIHPGVFIPVFNLTEETEPFTFFPWGNTTTKLQYWDENAYVSQMFLADPNEFATAGVKGLSAADEAVLAAQKEGIIGVNDEGVKSKKRKAEAKAATEPKKSAPAHLEFWSNRHAELHGQKPKPPNSSGTGPEQGKVDKTIGAPTSTLANVQSYSHPDKYCCYLCSRQFKSGAEVNKHERLSDLHKKNLENADLKAQAIAKMKKAGLPINSEPAEDTPEYRDRARERRKAFGSTNTTAPVKKINLPMKQPEPEPTPAKSKGAALLGKMGWNTGEGLGASGTGMTAPIQTDVYAAGVGLGAQGGKLGDASEEADRNTRGGYAEFVERAKDKAKERYLNMQ